MPLANCSRPAAQDAESFSPAAVAPVTAIVTSYGAAAFLREALASVLAQTRPPVEIIVVDDASPDDSVAVAREYAERDSRVRVIVHPENRGVSAARNTGLRAARTDLVAFLDGDDVWEPAHLETVVPLAEKHPEVAVSFSLVRTFGDQDRIWETPLPHEQPVDAFWPSLDACVAQTSGVIARREMVLAAGGYDESLRYCEDYDVYLRLAERHPFLCTHTVTVRYRRHGSSSSRQIEASRRAEYAIRQRLTERARAERRAEEYVRRLEDAQRAAYDRRFREAWDSRDAAMLDFLPSLASSVPGGERVAARWQRRRRLIPVARAWDRLPGTVRQWMRGSLRLVRP